MQNILKASFLVLFAFSLKNSKAQDVNLSTIKIGPFYLGMKLSEAEKVIGEKVAAKDLKKSYENYEHYIKYEVQGVAVELGFYEEYNENENAPKVYTVDRVRSMDKKLKTKSGITIGMSKVSVMEILDKQNVAYHYSKSTTYDTNGKPTNILVESLTIVDTKAEKSLILLIKNGKVTGFQLGYGGEDGC